MSEYEEIKRGPSREEWAAFRAGEVKDLTARPIARAAFALSAQAYFTAEDVELLHEVADSAERLKEWAAESGKATFDEQSEVLQEVQQLRDLAARIARLIPPRGG